MQFDHWSWLIFLLFVLSISPSEVRYLYINSICGFVSENLFISSLKILPWNYQVVTMKLPRKNFYKNTLCINAQIWFPTIWNRIFNKTSYTSYSSRWVRSYQVISFYFKLTNQKYVAKFSFMQSNNSSICCLACSVFHLS